MTTLLFLLASLCTAESPAPSEVPETVPTTIKVFLLAGQSNMEGYAVVDLDDEEDFNGGRGTLVSILEKPTGQQAFGHWRKTAPLGQS